MKKLSVALLFCSLGIVTAPLYAALSENTTAPLQLAHQDWESKKEWCEKHPKKCHRQWCRHHPGACKARWCHRHPEACRAKWCEKHPHKCHHKHDHHDHHHNNHY